jgi:Ni/Co efflux regulator RcnB
MKKFVTAFAACIILAGTGAAFAQPGPDNRQRPDDQRMQGPARSGDQHMQPGPGMGIQGHGPDHSDWKKGGHIAKDDWGRGNPVDYREHHLKRPPRGYEWRQVDGNYVLAAAATGLIASIILSAGH